MVRIITVSDFYQSKPPTFFQPSPFSLFSLSFSRLLSSRPGPSFSLHLSLLFTFCPHLTDSLSVLPYSVSKLASHKAQIHRKETRILPPLSSPRFFQPHDPKVASPFSLHLPFFHFSSLNFSPLHLSTFFTPLPLFPPFSYHSLFTFSAYTQFTGRHLDNLNNKVLLPHNCVGL